MPERGQDDVLRSMINEVREAAPGDKPDHVFTLESGWTIGHCLRPFQDGRGWATGGWGPAWVEMADLATLSPSDGEGAIGSWLGTHRPGSGEPSIGPVSSNGFVEFLVVIIAAEQSVGYVFGNNMDDRGHRSPTVEFEVFTLAFSPWRPGRCWPGKRCGPISVGGIHNHPLGRNMDGFRDGEKHVLRVVVAA